MQGWSSWACTRHRSSGHGWDRSPIAFSAWRTAWSSRCHRNSIARAKVTRIDDERVAFNRQHYNADIRDPDHYDLLVNAGTLGVEGAAAQTVAAFQFRFGSTT